MSYIYLGNVQLFWEMSNFFLGNVQLFSAFTVQQLESGAEQKSSPKPVVAQTPRLKGCSPLAFIFVRDRIRLSSVRHRDQRVV